MRARTELEGGKRSVKDILHPHAVNNDFVQASFFVIGNRFTFDRNIAVFWSVIAPIGSFNQVGAPPTYDHD